MHPYPHAGLWVHALHSYSYLTVLPFLIGVT
jgi:hypothetical protein